MARDTGELLLALKAAVDRVDDYAVESLTAELTTTIAAASEPVGEDDAGKMLQILRGGRRFKQLTQVASALLNADQNAPVVRRHYAQALIEEKKLSEAEDVLDSALRRAEDLCDLKEAAEVQGLRGRVYKQRYIDNEGKAAQKQTDLTRALNFYLTTYDQNHDENLYHGINAVALLSRAKADDVTNDNIPRIEEIARHLVNRVNQMTADHKAQDWDQATAMEAHLALGDYANAVLWLTRYVKSLAGGPPEGADAFKYNSTYRQLIEVWRLSRSREPGSLLLPLLDTAILRARDGTVSLDVSEFKAGAGRFEGTHGLDSWYPLDWMATARKRAARVVRISNRDTGQTKGTGFLVGGQTLARSTVTPHIS